TDPVSGQYGTQRFQAIAYDQFNAPLAKQPAFDWQVDNPNYVISFNGVLASGAVICSFNVTASAGGINSDHMHFDQTPTVATDAAAVPDTTAHTTATLSVLGADPDGESTLTYSWSLAAGSPDSVNFSDNGSNSAKNTTATFMQAGTYN